MGTHPPWGGRIHIYTRTERFRSSSSSEGHYHVSRAINKMLYNVSMPSTDTGK